VAIRNFSGAETGDLSEFSTVFGSVIAATDQKHTGNYSVKIVSPASTSQYYTTLYPLAATGVPDTTAVMPTFHTSFWLNINPNASAICTCAVIETVGSGNYFLAFDNLARLLLYASTGSLAFFSQVAHPIATWFRIELSLTVNPGVGINYFLRTVGLDGRALQETNGSHANTTVTGFSALSIGRHFTGTQFSGGFTAYYDDIIIDDASMPAPAVVKIAIPTGAGSNADWTSGGSTFDRVDEIPPDGDTTYISEASTTGISDFNMQDSATIGMSIAPVAVKPMAVVRWEATTGCSLSLWTKSGGVVAEQTPLTVGTISYFLMSAIQSLTNQAIPWTLATFDALQVGVSQHGAANARCTAIYASVLVPSYDPPYFQANATALFAGGSMTGPLCAWGISFAAKDNLFTGADQITWEIRNTNVPGGGILAASGTCSSAVFKFVNGLAYNNPALENPVNSLFCHLSNGFANAVPGLFIIQVDADPPTDSTAISTSPNPVV